MSRREKVFGPSGSANSGLQVTVTRAGIEVFGWYDGMVGIEGIRLTWAEIEAARQDVNQVLRRGYRTPRTRDDPQD